MIREIVVIVLLAGLLEMLLPENGVKRYVKVVMGLFIIVTLLVPIVSFLAQDESWAVSAWQYSDEGTGQVASVLSKGENISADMREATVRECEKRLARQVEAMVSLVPGVNSVQAKVQMKSGVEGDPWAVLEQVQLKIGLGSLDRKSTGDRELEKENISQVKPVIPIQIKESGYGEDSVKLNEGRTTEQITPDKPERTNESLSKKEIEKQIKDIVANFYGVKQEQIEVEFD